MNDEETPDLHDEASPEPVEPAREAEPPRPANRRRFLTAAALGSAAAALLNTDRRGRLSFGPGSVLAEVLSNVNCTANDVRIIGPGIIINEPCACSGNFSAVVRFRLNNNTGTQRYCVTVHLCPGRNSAGQVVVPAQDIIVGTVDPGERFYEVSIPNYPCGAGNVCFGEAGSGPDGGFAKGETCPAGKCCTVISWNVRANDPCPQPHGEIIKSKCRAQQVCITGRAASLTCIDDPADANDTCTPDCGGKATLRACVEGGTPPYTYTLTATAGSLKDGAGNPQSVLSFGPTNDTCRNFKVTVTEPTTYEVRICDSGSPVCCKTASTSLSANPIATPVLSLTAGPDCAGNATLTASEVNGATTYTFNESATTLQSGASRTLTKQFSVGQHCITCTASNASGCVSDPSNQVCLTVNPPVNTVLQASDNGCDGSILFTASASGGNGSYTFVFKVDGATVQSGTTASYTYKPKLTGTGLLDTACHSVAVQAFDTSANQCAGDIETAYVKQCVHSSITASPSECAAATP
jgi:hypothetical protein